MNAVEIEEAVSALAERPFDPVEFPFAFLEAFGNKETTIAKLRAGASNKSDIGGVLQVGHIHLKVAEAGAAGAALDALRSSPATQNRRNKVRFLLATDGEVFEVEDLSTGGTVACEFGDIPKHFSFLLPLAGIATVQAIVENELDTRAAKRLQVLYVELLKDNPAWGTAERRSDMNHFMARLIFCFFAEDTDIFSGEGLFTATIEQMSARDGSNTDFVISETFRAMNTIVEDRDAADLRPWANAFPYVNGGLFSGSTEVPKFSKIARTYLLHIGKLNWKLINPDIFGSMIQAVADDEERGALGMHYTSVPNILKVLNPLFLDDLREKLKEAETSPQKLLNLRKRMARIRVFDPACGSGNFLVIAYKEMRAIEAEINKRRGEEDRRTDIPLTNFRGIEVRDFPAEIARLALIIAEFQCDVLYRGPKLALLEFLPLDAQNWITCGNALRLDWMSICPPAGMGVQTRAVDLALMPPVSGQIEFENEGGETYVCGNPPYKGAREQTAEQKSDLRLVFDGHPIGWKTLDYVAGWFFKAAIYCKHSNAVVAFVSTNSICQGQHVPTLWPHIFQMGLCIPFAHTSFKWANLASHNAGVTVVVVALSTPTTGSKKIFSISETSETVLKEVSHINAYLVPGADLIVAKRSTSIAGLSPMAYGNYPGDGNHLTLSRSEAADLVSKRPDLAGIVRPVFGAQEFLKGLSRYCLWIDNDALDLALSEPEVAQRVDAVRAHRLSSRDAALNRLATRPHQYRDRNVAQTHLILVPTVSSEQREYLPADLKSAEATTTNQAFALYDAPLWNMALVASRMHLIWVATVCGKLETRYRYSNVLGWNTFPIPTLTDKNVDDLARCAEDICLEREAAFPATLADLYDPENMPTALREAHERNDEVLERIYIGRRFKNDTERLEKLFELYAKMTSGERAAKPKKARAGK